tara:strand:- start:162692 stop:163411 length:720 start_codon:yes stop_codon:yes gene_type:complete
VRAFLTNIYINEEINEKLDQLGIDITTSINECDCIIYDCPIEEVFNQSFDASQVKTIISKTEILTIDTLGPTSIEKKQSEEATFNAENVSEVSAKVKALINSIIDKNMFSDQSRYMSLVAIELVQNALIYQRELDKSENIQLSITEGKVNYSICVTDPFGALSHETILNKIQRAYREKSVESKKTGAGLGFSMVLSASDELIVKSEMNKKTTVCSIMNKYKRLKEYKSKTPTLYLRQGV